MTLATLPLGSQPLGTLPTQQGKTFLGVTLRTGTQLKAPNLNIFHNTVSLSARIFSQLSAALSQGGAVKLLGLVKTSTRITSDYHAHALLYVNTQLSTFAPADLSWAYDFTPYGIPMVVKQEYNQVDLTSFGMQRDYIKIALPTLTAPFILGVTRLGSRFYAL